MTSVLSIRDVLHDKILVSRESARLLRDPLQVAIGRKGSRCQELTIEFAGVEGMAPSFVDELLDVLHAAVGGGTRIRFAHAPTRLSLKFEAIARGRGLSVSEDENGWWTFESAATRS